MTVSELNIGPKNFVRCHFFADDQLVTVELLPVTLEYAEAAEDPEEEPEEEDAEEEEPEG